MRENPLLLPLNSHNAAKFILRMAKSILRNDRFVVGYMDKHGRIMVEQGSAKSGGSIQLDSGKGCWSFQKSAEASIAMLKDEYPDSPIIYMEYIDQRHNKENDNVNDNQ